MLENTNEYYISSVYWVRENLGFTARSTGTREVQKMPIPYQYRYSFDNRSFAFPNH